MNLGYPTLPHQRRHGPAGYKDHGSYRPWLRDEFSYACAFCMMRETWLPAALGAEGFSVDSVKTPNPEAAGEYDLLLYACQKCSPKQPLETDLDPCREGFGTHLSLHEDGLLKALTRQGQKLIDRFCLNRLPLQRFRQRLLALLELARAHPKSETAKEVRLFMAYPADLPDLESLRPPEGNTRPEGVADSCFARRQRGELPESY